MGAELRIQSFLSLGGEDNTAVGVAGSASKHTGLSTGQTVLEPQECQPGEGSEWTLPWAWLLLTTNTELQLQALKQQRSLLTIRGKS